MKTTRVLLAVAALSVLLAAGCQTARTGAGRWDYKVVERSFYPGQMQKQIDELAAEGWELVSVSTSKEPGSVPYGFVIVRKPK